VEDEEALFFVYIIIVQTIFSLSLDQMCKAFGRQK
jgi:hypothetical protein